MRSVMSHNFSQVPSAQIPRSQFNRSCGYKTAFNAGYLIPVFVDEALPGDTFNLRMNAFARLATPQVPIMDNLYFDSFFFAVPYRLVWDNWQRFNGEQPDPDSTTDFLTPVMSSTAVTGYATNSIHDYFGLPVGVPDIEHIAFYHRAYNLIWNEWFRDQNMQDSVTVPRDNGPDSPTLYTLLKRSKRHDYFTSCLPWPQKGPSVPLPLGTEAPIRSKGGDPIAITDRIYITNEGAPQGHGFQRYTQANDELGYTSASYPAANQAINWQLKDQFTIGSETGYNFADLTEATAASINELRQAFQIQKLYERDARGGTRYTEIIRAHFGVVSPDARLQRPEYLGGGTTYINVHPVPQTGATADDVDTPQGNLAAFGTMSASGHGFVKSFTEHCLILGIINVRADLTYQQGLDRMWSRRTRWDFYWPALSHIGEQAVPAKEIFCDGSADDDIVFGYQERYAEYRYKPSKITGLMRSTPTTGTSLDIWHLSQEFADHPVLDNAFIQENPPIDRISAVPTEPNFLLDAFFSLKCARPMPVYSVPGLIDHF